jgi:hypothetical protein
MSDILDEVKESISESRKYAILGRSIIGIFVFGVIFVIYLGISSWYENKRNEKIQEDGAILTQVVNSINYTKLKNKTSETEKEFQEKNQAKIAKLEKLGEASSSAYSALADVYLASVALIEGNPSKAIYYYQRIAKNTSYNETLREYVGLVEINAKLQFNKEVYDSSISQIHYYFQPYINDKDKSNLIKNKAFSNAMALTAVALNDVTEKHENSELYLKLINDNDSTNQNIRFIFDMLYQYMLQKKEIKNDTK